MFLHFVSYEARILIVTSAFQSMLLDFSECK